MLIKLVKTFMRVKIILGIKENNLMNLKENLNRANFLFKIIYEISLILLN